MSPEFGVLFWRDLWRPTIQKGSEVLIPISPLRCTIVLLHSIPFNWYKTSSNVTAISQFDLRLSSEFQMAILGIAGL